MTQSILTTTNLAWPTDWTAIFHNTRPLILDIGFGYGHSLDYLRNARVNYNIIGLEVDNLRLKKVQQRILREGWHNVRVVAGFAETALEHLFPPQSLAEVHVNFPDPWFKARHAGRRLIKRETVDAIASRLVTGGMFYLATDIRDYAEMSHDLLTDTPTLTNQLDAAWVNSRPEPFTTKYESRGFQQGREGHYFVYRRNDLPALDKPVITELEMPHFVFKIPVDLQTLGHTVQPQDYKDEQVSVRFLQRYFSEKTILFEVFIHEPTIDQRIALALVRKDADPHMFTLKLSALGHPRPTAGIHQAARVLVDALMAMSTDSVVIQDKLKSR
jgi:tRNA (guanine-N7-)-methyltransferase